MSEFAVTKVLGMSVSNWSIDIFSFQLRIEEGLLKTFTFDFSAISNK